MSWSFVFGISCFVAAVYCTAAATPRRCPLQNQMGAKIDDYTRYSPVDLVCRNYDPVNLDNENYSACRPGHGLLTIRLNNFSGNAETTEYTPGLGAYKVYRKAVTFNDARKTCQKDGAHMAVINSHAEAKHLAALARNARPHLGSTNQRYIRMGFHDLFHDTEYVNINGESLQTAGYENWDRDQPEKGDQECGGIDVSSGKLHDVSCIRPFAFICELPCVSGDDLVSILTCGDCSDEIQS